MKYTELQSHPILVFSAVPLTRRNWLNRLQLLDIAAIAITDRNSLAGIVRAHVAAKTLDIQFLPACRLDLLDGPSLFAYPTN